MARSVAGEGVLAESVGRRVVAARRVAERLGPEAVLVTVIVDSGLRYPSTDLYAP